MIALDHHRPASRKAGHRLDAEGRIGAVADDVAEHDEAIRRLAARMGEAAFQRLAIAVNIGEEGDAHDASPRTRQAG